MTDISVHVNAIIVKIRLMYMKNTETFRSPRSYFLLLLSEIGLDPDSHVVLDCV